MLYALLKIGAFGALSKKFALYEGTYFSGNIMIDIYIRMPRMLKLMLTIVLKGAPNLIKVGKLKINHV